MIWAIVGAGVCAHVHEALRVVLEGVSSFLLGTAYTRCVMSLHMDSVPMQMNKPCLIDVRMVHACLRPYSSGNMLHENDGGWLKPPTIQSPRSRHTPS